MENIFDQHTQNNSRQSALQCQHCTLVKGGRELEGGEGGMPDGGRDSGLIFEELKVVNYFTKVRLFFLSRSDFEYKRNAKINVVTRRHLIFHRRLSIATFKFNHTNEAQEKRKKNGLMRCVI